MNLYLYIKEHLRPGPPKAQSNAPTVYCYICGRQYGSKSIVIHQPQCLRLWHIQNAKLPKNKQRPEPVKPDHVLVGDGIDHRSTNDAYIRASMEHHLQPCENCGRRFNPSSLEVHQRSCTRDKPAKTVVDAATRRPTKLATTHPLADVNTNIKTKTKSCLNGTKETSGKRASNQSVQRKH